VNKAGYFEDVMNAVRIYESIKWRSKPQRKNDHNVIIIIIIINGFQTSLHH